MPNAYWEYRSSGIAGGMTLAVAVALLDGLADGFEDQFTRIRLVENGRTTGDFGLRPHPGIVVRGDENHRGDVIDRREPVTQLQSRQASG